MTRRYLPVAILLSILSASASAQTLSEREQASRRRAAAIDAQRNASGPATVLVGPSGPVDAAFKDFDVPFAVSRWYCQSQLPNAVVTRTDQVSASKSDQLKAAEDCRKEIQRVIKDESITLRYPTPDGLPVTAEAFPDLVVRVIGRGKTYPISPGGSTAMKISELKPAGSGDRVDFLILKDKGATPVGAFGLTFADIPQLDPVRSVATGTMQGVPIRLDRTGVASPLFLNPRWPVLLGPQPGGGTISDWQDKAFLVFTNRVGDRQFIVNFPNIKEDARLDFLAAGFPLTDCGDGACHAIVVVPAGGRGERRVPVKLLREAYVGKDGRAKVVAFDVELFHDDAQLANPRGYFSLVPYPDLDFAGASSKWSASTTAQFGSSPDLADLAPAADEDPVITDDASRGQGNDTKFAGSARISLKQSLGPGASGEFDVRLKSGDFGTKATLAATKYRLNVYGFNGISYSGGLFDIAEPSEAIALSESGENVGIHYGIFDANYILRKHVAKLKHDVLDFKESAADRNHSATLVQLHGVPGVSSKHAVVDLYGTYGRKDATRCLLLVDGACPPKPDNAPADPAKPPTFELRQWYATLGTEVSFGFKEGWGGSAALYYSRLDVTNRPAGADAQPGETGTGTVGLITVAYTKFEKTDVIDAKPSYFTLRAQFGAGTGDDSGRSGNQGYLGETAGFSPDQLFLALLAPAIHTRRGQVGAGLINKQYVGVLFTSPRWSPLAAVAKALKVPETDIGGQTMTIKFHQYRFNQAVNGGKYAGSEVDFDVSLESPSSVTYSIGLAGFWPGASLTAPGDATISPDFAKFGPLIRGFQWSAIARLTVKM